MLQLILGGARSGKSRLAEQTAKETGLSVIYIATAQALDAEMQQRITHHQQQRPAHWQVFEEPIYLADRLLQLDQPDQLILVDCLTLWLSNLLLAEDPALQQQQMQKLFEVLPQLHSQIILVSNETGLGVVPMGEISRCFVDEAGRLHQTLGQLANKVMFCVAGFPMILKDEK
ncbi:MULTISPECIES: bifunctional adenosylcobinamide kinase/adenosylcobinamide-phosphate guanylyltransferase [Acinetobacter]|uniref:bifunctional adenosylcobinamide kinase/adenosylcobinamide-phosphate guanylyltransferase n=1 Tax=Acinetobacter TaxID=469 RepID=UPI00051C0AF6|nr:MULTISPECIES: bifunctional adenosylcobinamide kinase/adenosylcobinamide-phosphate guanylyltransferase [Acinetobacter]MCH7378678.1 bifunctional adenosylcobinamide kinase/adenosylcobinamide-phosphate guanylyltransferase [Acinetobacter higginsii]MCJ0826992.1 bifunctional adenosylcobinamide kinase/adenosylcobinamide-phosphate guanylyltransferase [Acinetobacter sp. NIPH1876]MDO3663721.1 bifunctional adenosylcobinamide kinase/adenosylcobinamide-phosphate guanylyltransferase [Acinetobacter higginsii